jgi:hypothetical protein
MIIINYNDDLETTEGKIKFFKKIRILVLDNYIVDDDNNYNPVDAEIYNRM